MLKFGLNLENSLKFWPVGQHCLAVQYLTPIHQIVISDNKWMIISPNEVHVIP